MSLHLLSELTPVTVPVHLPKSPFPLYMDCNKSYVCHCPSPLSLCHPN